MKRILYILAGLLLLFLIWLFRPGERLPDIVFPGALPEPGFTVENADEAIRRSELNAGPLKPDNHARIVWNPDYRGRKAPCSMVYIHGFSASFGEGAPFHVRTARELGCHLYVTRLHGHGLRTDEALKDMNPDSLLADAARALAIGKLTGERVILAGNSMGGLLAVHLASMHPDAVDALVLLAPLLDFANPASFLFDKEWGQRLARLILRDSYLQGEPENDDHARYWYNVFHVNSLKQFETMRKQILALDPAANIRVPVFTGYYYKNEDEKDDQVSISAIHEFEQRLATPESMREFRAFPDSDAHVITSAHRTRHHEEVTAAVIAFLKEHVAD